MVITLEMDSTEGTTAGQIHQMSVAKEVKHAVCRMCPERPYVELQVPMDVAVVHDVSFIIKSRDQGNSLSAFGCLRSKSMEQDGPIPLMVIIRIHNPTPGSLHDCERKVYASMQLRTRGTYSSTREAVRRPQSMRSHGRGVLDPETS